MAGPQTKDVRVAPPPRIGDFEIAREIGRGSMGVVYEAIQISLGRRVALKTFAAAGRSDQAVERFKREAGAAAKLVHPGIVPVYAVGEEEQFHYYAMKLVEGKTLRELIYTDKIPPERSAKIARKVAEALDYAHKQGIIHRDIKPTNIIVQPNDQPVITDFGLAKDLALNSMTQAGVVLGTPTHMSPEQAAGTAEVDHRTDVYALGACLYEMLTFRLPFNAQNLDELLLKIAKEEPEPLRRIDGRIPLDLEAIVLKALAKRPKERYESAGALAEDLARFLAGDRVRAERRTLGRELSKWAGRHRALTVGLLLVAALGVGAVIFVATSHMARKTHTEKLIRELEQASAGRDKAMALAIAEQILKLDPTNEDVLKRRAELSVAREREAAEARRVRNREEAQKYVQQGLEAADRAHTLSGNAAERAISEALDAFGRALGLDPENQPARAGRGRIYLARALEAERHGDEELAAVYFGFVREHNPDGLYDGPLRAEGSLTVRASVPGSRIVVDRVVTSPDTGEAVRQRIAESDTPPWTATAVTVGSYVVEVTADGFATAVVPLSVERGGRDDIEVRLLRPRDIPAGFVYVPAGPCRFGGDPKAIRPLPRERRRVEGFFIAQRETTCAEFARFLSALPPADADALLPRAGPSRGYAKIFWRDAGEIRYPPGWSPERPVTGVTYDAALRYAAWRAGQDQRPIRLPTEFEWERAARGGDGRTYPWGESDPLTRANLVAGDDPGLPRPVGTTPGDASIFGVMDMLGNASEWTSSMHNGRPTLHILRGGSYMPMLEPPRICSRAPTEGANPPEHAGIRLACDLPTP